MSIVTEDGRQQICCDNCPASYPNTYAGDDFRVMIADAKAAGWSIRPVQQKPPGKDTSDLFGAPPRVAGGQASDKWTHACPVCKARTAATKELF